MIDFSEVKLEQHTRDELQKLKINYAFQPIYKNDGNEIFGYEALMRPTDMNVMELIHEYTKEGKLHYLELATFIGASLEYVNRGYDKYFSVNSFPSVYLTQEEVIAMNEYVPRKVGKEIIEVLEYPEMPPAELEKKAKMMRSRNLRISIDDFGSGNHNSIEIVDMFNPMIVKLDKHMIQGIADNKELRADYSYLRDKFHERGIMVLAECVETKEDCEYLMRHGIDLLQGYYLGMPQ